jgi:hypothetical protein
MTNSDVNPDSSSGSTDGGQDGNRSDADDATLDPDALADSLAAVGSDVGQTGHEVSLRGDALLDQCAEIAETLRENPDALSGEEIDALVAEAIEGVGDVEAWASGLFDVLSAAEEARASLDS